MPPPEPAARDSRSFRTSQTQEALTICDRWVTREDLDEHIRSAEYRLLLAVIDLSVIPPDISFDYLEHIGGLDIVHALRAPQQTIREEA